ncbi:MAG: HAMP domain-containing sensor histidine kinase [Chitinophagaceae bacterium]
MRSLSNFLSYRLPESRAGHQAAVAYRGYLTFLHKVRRIGLLKEMSVHEKNKLAIFNYLNFFQLCTGLLLPLIGFLYVGNIPLLAWTMAMLPALVSGVVLLLNANRQYTLALLVYFVLYPFCTCLAYINGINLGVELSFVLYGILSVFFIQERSYMLFSIGFSMISYFVLAVMLKRYPFHLEQINFLLYLINQALAIVYIFYGLYLVKTENSNFNLTLQHANQEMQKQSSQLQQQAQQLQELNSLKSKLFSVISHDLKAPMYALRNLFENIQSQDLPGSEIKELVPDIKKDLNHTIGLMENLLQWAKTQMQAESALPAAFSCSQLTSQVISTVSMQAEAKNILIRTDVSPALHAWGDPDMIQLVLRNLLSNAIKFTPPGGTVYLGVNSLSDHLEFFIKDSGKGISPEELEQIKAGVFYTSAGTAQEQGTGLGLLLCREFLTRNNSQLRIETAVNVGSTFSFTLPKAE